MDKNELNLDEVKKIQMDVLSAIDHFCQSKGIQYSLGDGSLLGAVRHNGYIPWDDDIDIVMLREEYCRLLSEFPITYRGHYKIASLERDEKWSRPYAVAYDDNTLLVESGRDISSIGVKVDIFPVDNIPNEVDVERYQKRVYFWMLYYGLSGVAKGSSFLKTVCLKFISFSTFFYSRRKMAKRIQKMLSKYSLHNSERAFEWTLYNHSISIFPKSIFDKYQLYPFEDKFYLGIVDADNYLSSVYGNYMELPPLEKRTSHHSFKAYRKNKD